MKKLLGLMFILLLTGCVEYQEGYTNINKLVSPISINEYFIHDNQYWKKCWEYEDKIWDEEEGYQLKEYKNNYIIDVGESRNYDYNIYQKNDGSYEMKVNIECEYNVVVKIGVFGSATEELRYDGGTVLFNMDITKKEGRYILNDMEAYKHIIK